MKKLLLVGLGFFILFNQCSAMPNFFNRFSKNKNRKNDERGFSDVISKSRGETRLVDNPLNMSSRNSSLTEKRNIDWAKAARDNVRIGQFNPRELQVLDLDKLSVSELQSVVKQVINLRSINPSDISSIQKIGGLAGYSSLKRLQIKAESKIRERTKAVLTSF